MSLVAAAIQADHYPKGYGFSYIGGQNVQSNNLFRLLKEQPDLVKKG